MDLVAVFVFPDTEEKVVVQIRRGVCLLPPTCPVPIPDLTVTTASTVWRDILAKERTAVTAGLTGALVVEPSIRSLATFFQFFDTDV